MTTNTTALVTLAASFAALYAGHQFGDHWIQTQHQADTKGRRGWPARIACAMHVATYTATQLILLGTLWLAFGLPLHGWSLTAGLALSAVTHYIADRRTPLRKAADALGKNPTWLTQFGGLYQLDQAWHVLALFGAAVLIAL